MKRKFRDEDIIKFLYDEMPPQESEGFLDALAKNEELWSRYEYFQEVEDRLGTLEYNPSDASVDKVMEFVKKDGKAIKRKKTNLISGPLAGMAVAVVALLLTCFSLGVFPSPRSELKPIAKVEKPRLVHEVVDTRISWEQDEIDNQLESLKEKTQDMKASMLGDDDFL